MPSSRKETKRTRKPLPSITPTKNGPHMVEDLGTLTDPDDKPLRTEPKIFLCRCGGSTTKPYCSGAHMKNGFDSRKITGGELNHRDDYEGKGIVIHDNRGICSHAGHCTDGLPQVWDRDAEPWIDAKAATPAEIIEVIEKCPSGALSYSVDGKEHRDRDSEPEIHLRKNGPYEVRGGVELVGEEWGEGASREHFTLCRCGGSKNKPFCDGTHWRIGFRDDR